MLLDQLNAGPPTVQQEAVPVDDAVAPFGRPVLELVSPEFGMPFEHRSVLVCAHDGRLRGVECVHRAPCLCHLFQSPCTRREIGRVAPLATTVTVLFARARPLTGYPKSKRRMNRFALYRGRRGQRRRGALIVVRWEAPRMGYSGCLLAIYSVLAATCDEAGPEPTIGSRALRTIRFEPFGVRAFGGNVAPRTDLVACMITVRKALWHLPTELQYRLLHRLVAGAQGEELDSPLKRVVARHGSAGLELEFWFQGCSNEEATHYVSATLRDAAASITEVS